MQLLAWLFIKNNPLLLARTVFSLAFALASIFLGKTMARRDHITVLMLSFLMIGAGFGVISLAEGTSVLYLRLLKSHRHHDFAVIISRYFLRSTSLSLYNRHH
jgi:hypothetical protein